MRVTYVENRELGQDSVELLVKALLRELDLASIEVSASGFKVSSER